MVVEGVLLRLCEGVIWTGVRILGALTVSCSFRWTFLGGRSMSDTVDEGVVLRLCAVDVLTGVPDAGDSVAVVVIVSCSLRTLFGGSIGAVSSRGWMASESSCKSLKRDMLTCWAQDFSAGRHLTCKGLPVPSASRCTSACTYTTAEPVFDATSGCWPLSRSYMTMKSQFK